jgi:hypothetical protein
MRSEWRANKDDFGDVAAVESEGMREQRGLDIFCDIRLVNHEYERVQVTKRSEKESNLERLNVDVRLLNQLVDIMERLPEDQVVILEQHINRSDAAWSLKDHVGGEEMCLRQSAQGCREP